MGWVGLGFWEREYPGWGRGWLVGPGWVALEFLGRRVALGWLAGWGLGWLGWACPVVLGLGWQDSHLEEQDAVQGVF